MNEYIYNIKFIMDMQKKKRLVNKCNMTDSDFVN